MTKDKLRDYLESLNSDIADDKLDSAEAGFMYGYELDAKKTIEEAI